MSRRTIILEEVKKLGLDPNKNHSLEKLSQVKRAGGSVNTAVTVESEQHKHVKHDNKHVHVDEIDHDLDDREDVGDDEEDSNETQQAVEIIEDITDRIEIMHHHEPAEELDTQPKVGKKKFKKTTHNE